MGAKPAPTRYVETARTKRYRLGDLLPDAENRPVRENRVLKIASDFDFAKWTPPVVRENGGGLPTILDGHHRVQAACLVGLEDVEVITYCHPAIESDSRVGEMYLGVNDTLAAQPVEKFKMRLRAGDETAVGIAATIEAAGFHGVSAEREKGYIQSPGACEWVYNGGPYRKPSHAALGATLQILARAYGRTPDAVRKDVIRGVGMFVLSFPRAKQERVVKNLRKRYPEPDDLLDKGRDISEAMNYQANKGVAEAIRQAYNSAGGGGQQLPSWN